EGGSCAVFLGTRRTYRAPCPSYGDGRTARVLTVGNSATLARRLVIELTWKMHRAVKRHGQNRHRSQFGGTHSCQLLAERGRLTCGFTLAGSGYWRRWSFLHFPRST